MEKWCKEHITVSENWFVTQSGNKYPIDNDWKFCPVCGASRPPAKKRLAEVIREAYGKRTVGVAWEESESKAAITWFLGVVEEAVKHEGECRTIQDIKARLAEEGV